MDIPLVRLRLGRRGTFRTRVFVAAAVLIALVAGATNWNTRHSSTLPISTEWTTQRLPELGIQFSYPASWHLQEVESAGMALMTGALVSNVDHWFEHPYLGPAQETSALEMRGLPEDLVVLSFEQLKRFNPIAAKTTGLPLFLDYAHMPIDPNPYGAGLLHEYIGFRVGGQPRSGVQVYIGDVTDEERAAIYRILASVQPLD